MSARLRALLLALLMLALAAGVTGVLLRVLYLEALADKRTRLLDVVGNQVTLLDALGRLGGERGVEALPSGVFAATLGYTRFGESGELTLARLQDEHIVFLLRHRGDELEHPAPVPVDWDRAEPMRRALAGETGVVCGPDYRGETVLAAFDFATVLGLGVVAQVDLGEIRAPFVRAGKVAAGVAVVLVTAAVGLFVLTTNPFIRRLERRVAERTADLARANAELQREVSERRQVEQRLLDNQRQLRVLAGELAMTEERERRQLAADLHDHISQTLAVTQMKLDAVKAAVPQPQQRQRLDEVSALVDRMDDDIRALMFELSPPVLQLGLAAGVRWLAEQLAAQHQLRIAVVDEAPELSLDEDIRALMFRVIRELLLNVVKHARARQARVRLWCESERVHAEVTDDGVGFDPAASAAAGAHHAFGLFSVRERLGSVGGTLEIRSERSQGTAARVSAPLRLPNAVVGEVT